LVSKDAWVLRKNILIGGVNHNVVTSPSGIEFRFSTADVRSQDGAYYYLTSKTDLKGNIIEVAYRNKSPEPLDAKTAYVDTITLKSDPVRAIADPPASSLKPTPRHGKS